MTLPHLDHLAELMAKARLGALVYDNTGTQVWEATGRGPGHAFDVRGWGWIQKEPDAEAMHDARGKLLADALNALPALIAIAKAATDVHHNQVQYDQVDDSLWEELGESLALLHPPTETKGKK